MRVSIQRLLCYALLGVGCLRAGVPTEPPFPPEVAEVVYGPHERNVLDLWLAKADAPTPLVIFMHGGGWHGGDKAAVPEKLLRFLLDNGISVASINYRFTSMALLPAPQMDGARAVQFLRANAGQWNIDPDRIGAIGVSAGGCTALWLATHDSLADPFSEDPVARASSRLQAAVGLSAQTSLDAPVIQEWIGEMVLNHPMIPRALGLKNRQQVLEHYEENAALLKEASAFEHISSDDPPLLLAYPTMAKLPAPSTGQGIHHAIFGVKLKERADAEGVECILRIEDQAGDSVPTPEAFLLEKLQPKS